MMTYATLELACVSKLIELYQRRVVHLRQALRRTKTKVCLKCLVISARLRGNNISVRRSCKQFKYISRQQSNFFPPTFTPSRNKTDTHGLKHSKMGVASDRTKNERMRITASPRTSTEDLSSPQRGSIFSNLSRSTIGYQPKVKQVSFRQR